jgi:hypothetical protein
MARGLSFATRAVCARSQRCTSSRPARSRDMRAQLDGYERRVDFEAGHRLAARRQRRTASARHQYALVPGCRVWQPRRQPGAACLRARGRASGCFGHPLPPIVDADAPGGGPRCASAREA